MNGGGDEGVGRGDGGVDSPKWLDFGNGDETFRSWLYEWDLSGDTVAFLTDDPSIPLVLPLTSPLGAPPLFHGVNLAGRDWQPSQSGESEESTVSRWWFPFPSVILDFLNCYKGYS